ncbi:succinylarginine dihydrolase [Oceanospirillum multiglobuliferum]|uniref:N-succinylarginine dihydrolase n=1 Tax=Oceanospirillum multiglobuliferum TaxID=64969 RepID=A0A1T4QTA7_9GAMM|nr:N-succinylarginine dihydrolase [Oceanospirillum multiglobuliferum]OPX57130.1 N-succinylarginine dihydrolase [Oceanospirillum multiglobuliferum]SKA06970.1 succinylarginine dihydrolase [Oceanospirillum multiglobuliferum]
MKAFEANFDGLVGPTHNYSGLSFGNVASQSNEALASNPKLAALQGLAKMKALHDMGLVQGVLAPQERPDINTLRRLGFTGSDAEVLASAAKDAPRILAACCSASSMWTANAATVSPSADTADGKVHFTPANLTNKFHRSIEHETTGRILQATFSDKAHFTHHGALPSVEHFGDEGAANHTRFCHNYGDTGVEFFVYGRSAFDNNRPAPKRYPARHTLEASEAVARIHGLSANQVVYAQQNPEVIDQGVFHNDVIAVGNRNTLFCHELAFVDQTQVKQELSQKLGGQFNIIEVPNNRVTVQDAVTSYLFNSQLLSLTDGRTLLVIPDECRQNPAVWQYLTELRDGSSPIDDLQVFDLKQSMCNGGGPACLRLRVVLNDAELQAFNQSTRMSETLFKSLNNWVERHYRDRLTEADLADPQLLIESRTALDELTRILNLGSVYPFQI